MYLNNQKSSLFLYKSCFSTISSYICQNIHFTNITVNNKSFILKKFKTFWKTFFVYRLRLLINFIFSLTQKISAFTICIVKYENFDLYCFHYLNRYYGRFVLVYLLIFGQYKYTKRYFLTTWTDLH